MAEFDMEIAQKITALTERCLAAEAERDAALEREQALAAHVERLETVADAVVGLCQSCLGEDDDVAALANLIDETPTTSLARRDAHIQWETCERLAAALRLHGLTEAEGLVNAIGERVKRQAEETKS